LCIEALDNFSVTDLMEKHESIRRDHWTGESFTHASTPNNRWPGVGKLDQQKGFQACAASTRAQELRPIVGPQRPSQTDDPNHRKKRDLLADRISRSPAHPRPHIKVSRTTADIVARPFD
jgi:hypothetical protein